MANLMNKFNFNCIPSQFFIALYYSLSCSLLRLMQCHSIRGSIELVHTLRALFQTRHKNDIQVDSVFSHPAFLKVDASDSSCVQIFFTDLIKPLVLKYALQFLYAGLQLLNHMKLYIVYDLFASALVVNPPMLTALAAQLHGNFVYKSIFKYIQLTFYL